MQDTGAAAGVQGRERRQAVSSRPVCIYITLMWWETAPLIVLRLVHPNHLVHLQILPSMYKPLLGEHKSYPNHDKPQTIRLEVKKKQKRKKAEKPQPSKNPTLIGKAASVLPRKSQNKLQKNSVMTMVPLPRPFVIK